MNKFIICLVLLSLKFYQNDFQFIDHPIIYSSNYDPSPKLLPQDWIDKLMGLSDNFPKRKQTFNNGSKSLNCKDPSESKLIQMLTQLYYEHFEVNDMILKMHYSLKNHNQSRGLPTLNTLFSFKSKESKIITSYGSAECDIAKLSTHFDQVPMCPWHYNLIERNDRYPFKRTTAVCNCKSKCLANSSNKYKCVPIKLPMPVMTRSKCHNGYFEWINSMEEVTSSCACVLSNN